MSASRREQTPELEIYLFNLISSGLPFGLFGAWFAFFGARVLGETSVALTGFSFFGPCARFCIAGLAPLRAAPPRVGLLEDGLELLPLLLLLPSLLVISSILLLQMAYCHIFAKIGFLWELLAVRIGFLRTMIFAGFCLAAIEREKPSPD